MTLWDVITTCWWCIRYHFYLGKFHAYILHMNSEVIGILFLKFFASVAADMRRPQYKCYQCVCWQCWLLISSPMLVKDLQNSLYMSCWWIFHALNIPENLPMPQKVLGYFTCTKCALQCSVFPTKPSSWI